MGEEQNESSDFFAKEWNSVFFEERNLKEDIPWRERKDASVNIIEPPVFSTERNLEETAPEEENGGVLGPALPEMVDDFDSFLWDCEEWIPGCNIAEVADFVKGCTTLDDLRSARGSAGTRRGAWFDERSSTSSTGDLGIRVIESEEQKDRLMTATGLYRRLRVKSPSGYAASRANRRHCRALDANFILALAETALYNEMSLLKDAIWKHIAFQTSIRVKLPKGFPTFQMEIHIPSFELRSYLQSGKPPFQPIKDSTRQWTDLTFLEIQGKPTEVFGFRETHFTLVICGLTNRRWNGYSFLDSHDDDEDLEQQVGPYLDLHRDPISDGILDANMPIEDPREYFLTILDIRFENCLKEWRSLVRPIECSIKQYKIHHPSAVSKDSAQEVEDVKKTFDWTRQTMDLLNRLQQALAKTIEAWKTFSARDGGDINYFSDFKKATRANNANVRKSFQSIRETIEEMVGLKHCLKILHEDCRSSSEALHLLLTLQANEAVRDNGVFANFTISIISPVMLAMAYFSIPEAAAPFKLNAMYFPIILAIIAAIIQVLFMGFTSRPSWWKKANTWLQKLCPSFRLLGNAWVRDRTKVTEQSV